MDNLKEDVLKSLKQNKSLNKISKEFSLNKTTIFYWYKKLGKSKITKINIKHDSQDLIGEFIGIFAGDGSYNMDREYHHKVTIHLNSRDKKYIRHVKSVMRKLFSKNPHNLLSKKDNTTILKFNSKDVYLFVKDYLQWEGKKYHSVCLKHDLRKYSRKFLIGFLRGVFDTDGHINRKIPRANFATVSEALVKNVEEALTFSRLTYSSRRYVDKRGNRKPLFLIEIRRSDLNRFFELIKPVH
jgi:hypothetical protein